MKKLRLRLAVVMSAAYAFLCMPAFADTSGVDVTGIVTDTLMLVITGLVGTGVLVLRSYLSKRFGLQLSDSDTAALNVALVHGAHDFIANEVLKGKPVTIDLKLEAANAALEYAKAHEGEALERLRAAGLDPITLSEKAQARAAVILNQMPTPAASAAPAVAG
jgi:hypothetical protein